MLPVIIITIFFATKSDLLIKQIKYISSEPGPQISVRSFKYYLSFFTVKTCYGYSKLPFQPGGSIEHPKPVSKKMNKKRITIIPQKASYLDL